MRAHVVSHTHWDREWYHSFERFRQRLVALIDDLLDHPPTANESFLLDGQAILIEDYLGVRPERAAELATLLRDGRLEAGPWFVLADELIPSGEALVRNLLTGRRVLRRYRAESPPVLYCPDSFGHPAALPEIAAGFNLPMTILWRGYGGRGAPRGDTVRWIAPSGASTMVYHLPRDGYEFGSHLPDLPDAARDRWARMRTELAPRSTTGVVLIPNGADHHARQPDLETALQVLEASGGDDRIERSSLTRFASDLVERASSMSLPEVRGELRNSYGYTWTLQGTFATRAHEKRLNALAERLLLRETEPWVALAAFASGDVARRSLVQAAWRDVLTAHPHDTLCGCSIDAVASAMEERLHAAIRQAAGLRDDAVLDLIGHDPALARRASDKWKPIVIIRNPAARVRSGVAIIEAEEFLAHVPVGPGSAGVPPARVAAKRAVPKIPTLGAIQLLGQTITNARIESPNDYPDNDLIVRRRVAAWVNEVPGYGIVCHPIGGARGGRSLPDHVVITEESLLDNGRLRISVDATGSIRLEQVETGRTIASLLTIVDEADIGDLYTPSPRPLDHVVRFDGVRRVHRGPLRGELALRYRVLDGDARRTRATLDVHLILDAAAHVLRIDVRGENRVKDHRLRLALHSEVPNAEVWADAAFGPVRREPIVADVREYGEIPSPTAPLHRYVSLFSQSAGFSLISDGLAEYEARDDGAILVTLVRSVGELSRNDLRERPGHAGWPAATPGAQCLGPFGAEFGVLLHGPRSAATLEEIEHAADDVLNPITGTTLRSALDVPSPFSGLALMGFGLAFSTLKVAEDGDWLVARCVNLRDEAVEGRWRLSSPVKEAHLARLDETPIGELKVDGREVVFVAAPHAITTVILR